LQTLAQEIHDKDFDVIIVSPEPTTAYTPLLASAACGLFNFSLAEEPVRHKGRAIRYIQACVTDIDFANKTCYCSPAFKAFADRTFELSYDHVVIAPGCTSQTFGTPGVAE
jgi:NADH:ubiquinone reductase (non-electrogenic)